jgi:hypothetical protein
MPLRLYSRCIIAICCSFFSVWASYAQLPVCNLIYAKTTKPDSIYNYDPALPVSRTNPIANTITMPSTLIGGLTVSPVLGSGSTTLTFYSVEQGTGIYMYYNPATSAWVHTGHSSGGPYILNIAAGGGLIYGMEGITGNVYKYNGKGSATFLLRVPGFRGAGPNDLLADCEGNWYIFDQTDTIPFLRKYDSSGILLHSWTLSNPSGISVKASAGFAIIGNTLYTDNTVNNGIASYTLGFDTLTLNSTKPIGKFINDDFGSCAGAVLSIPTVNITAGQNNICAGIPITFTAKSLGGGAAPTYQWKVNGSPVGSSSSLTTYTYAPANGDVVTCTMTSSSPCASVLTGTSNTITMIINPSPLVPTTITPLNYCVGTTATSLTATGSNLKWYTTASGGTGSTTAPTPNTAIAGSTNYYVSQTNLSTGCESPRALINIQVHAISTIPVVATPVKYCQYAIATTLTATGTNQHWYTTATGGTGSPTAPTPNTDTLGTTNYYVSQTDTGGCESARATITVDINNTPVTPTVISPINLCVGTPATALTASGSLLLWYNSATGGTGSTTAPIPNTTSVGTTNYYVSQSCPTIGSESPRATITAIVQPLPTISIIPVGLIDYALCHHDTTTIKAIAPSAINYQWSRNLITIPGATTPTLKIGSTGTYSITVKDIYGCTNNQSVNVFNDTLPKPTLSPTDLKICEDVTVMLYCSPAITGYKYQWLQNNTPITSAGLISSAIPVNTTATYKVMVTDIYGCVDSTNESGLSTYPSIPKPTILRFDPVLKLNNTYSYYQWFRNKKTIPGANTLTYTMLYDGNYYAEVTDANGCSKYSDTITITNLSVGNLPSQQDGIHIYPNPSDGTITIATTNANDKIVAITVYDILGRVVLQQPLTFTNNQSSLKISAPSGTYIVELKDNNGNLDRGRITIL